MQGVYVDPAAVDRVSKMYNSSTAAAEALGMHLAAYCKACRRLGVQTPPARRGKYQVQRRPRRQRGN